MFERKSNSMKMIIIVVVSFFVMTAFYMSEKPAIRGSISVSGNGLKDVDVVLRRVPGGEIAKSGKTDLKGTFLFEDVDPGQSNLFISGVNIIKVEDIVSGKLQFNGKPLDKVSVYFYNTANEMKGSAITDSQGNYSFSGLPIGLYYLKAELTIVLPPSN